MAEWHSAFPRRCQRTLTLGDETTITRGHVVGGEKLARVGEEQLRHVVGVRRLVGGVVGGEARGGGGGGEGVRKGGGCLVHFLYPPASSEEFLNFLSASDSVVIMIFYTTMGFLLLNMDSSLSLALQVPARN